jgi:hypothetical protein
MVICNNCRHEEPTGAIFCSECGAQLLVIESVTTNAFKKSPSDALRSANGYQKNVPVSVNAWITLHVMDSGQLLPITDRNEFTLGRIAEGQPIMPDIDLSPYKAYENGVSRLHVVIRQRGTKILVMDLGSANGSYLNGQRLTPNLEEPLRHSDVLALGKLRLQILLNQNGPQL